MYRISSNYINALSIHALFDVIHNYCVAVWAAFLCCRYSDHYRWKKVTSCIYNLLGGQRWVDHYSEMVITNGNQLLQAHVCQGDRSPAGSDNGPSACKLLFALTTCRLVTGAPRSMRYMVMCTHQVERRSDTCTVPGMRLCSVGRPVMMLSVCGKLVRTMYMQQFMCMWCWVAAALAARSRHSLYGWPIDQLCI